MRRMMQPRDEEPPIEDIVEGVMPEPVANAANHV